MNAEFVFLDQVVPQLRWDAKYATWDNFTGKPVDGYLANRVLGTRALGAALTKAQEHAHQLGFGLLLWDGYRPQRAVDAFVRWAGLPEDRSTKQRHYPRIERSEMFSHGYVALKSGHSRGSTVDLTLYSLSTGNLADMGGGHDLMDPLSHHGADGIPAGATQNRQTLCTIMAEAGFSRYEHEWWHYTLRDEPFPETYFDFPIISECDVRAASPRLGWNHVDTAVPLALRGA